MDLDHAATNFHMLQVVNERSVDIAEHHGARAMESHTESRKGDLWGEGNSLCSLPGTIFNGET